MRYRRWLQQNTTSLVGKRIAITGSTGGLGTALCHYLAMLGASLVLLDRNPNKSAALQDCLQTAYPGTEIMRIPVDMEDMATVCAACDRLEELGIDALILNAGAYAVPRRTCTTGYDNVFQINCVAPYYMTRRLLPCLRRRRGRVVAVGSIAHTYRVSDPMDVDFATRRAASQVYGNAKRRLMCSLYELFAQEQEVTLAVVHPGITFTNITAHYPPWLFAVIKHPMKWVFMPVHKAALSLLRGVFDPCGYHQWIGPWLFSVWGLPVKRRLHTISREESRRIGQQAEDMWKSLKKGRQHKA